MNRPRFSLRALMGVVVVLAMGFAAWRIPWLPLRASALFTLVLLILLTATLGAALKARSIVDRLRALRLGLAEHLVPLADDRCLELYRRPEPSADAGPVDVAVGAQFVGAGV